MADAPSSTRFNFAVTAWGRRDVDVLLSVGLPSQLSGQNLPAIPRVPDAIYEIYTTRQGESEIGRSQVFKLLQNTLETRFVHVDEFLSGGEAPSRLACFRQMVESADSRNAALYAFSADQIWSDGSLSNAAKRIFEGYSAVFCAGLRSAEKSLVEVVRQRFLAHDRCSLSIPARELVRAGLEHMHPAARWMRTWFWDGPDYTSYPTHIVLDVSGEGVSASSCMLHPVVINAEVRHLPLGEASERSYVFKACPNTDKIYVARDSDDVVHVAIAGGDDDRWSAARERNALAVPGPSPGEPEYSDHHRLFIRAPVRLHHEEITASRWRRTEDRSQLIAERIEWGSDLPDWILLFWEPKALIKRIEERYRFHPDSISDRDRIAKQLASEWTRQHEETRLWLRQVIARRSSEAFSARDLADRDGLTAYDDGCRVTASSSRGDSRLASRVCEEREQPRAACAAAQPDLAALAGQLGIHQGGNPILREAESALERGDLLQAGARYLAVARGAPDMGEAWLGVSSVLLMTGEFDRATELIDRTIAEQDKAKAWVQLCRILMTLGEWERAEELVGRAISLKPSDAEAYSLQALILRNLGSDEEELQALKRAVQHSSDDPQLWETLITAFERVSGADAALDYLDGNRDAVPKMPAIDLRRVQLSMSAGRMREAEAGIERVLEAEPDNAEAHSIRAFVLLKSARREEAIEALQRATQCSPEDGQLWETLITVLEHLRGPEATLDYLASNGHKAPETLSMEVRKARLCISAGRTQEAEGRMRSILQANPDSAGVHSVHALLLSTTGRREDAIGALERATRYSPGDPRLWEALIRELEDVRGPERTVEYVGLNRNAVPRDRPLEERLVRLCLTVGKIEEATIWMRRLVEPDLDDVRAEDSFSEFLAEVAPEC